MPTWKLSASNLGWTKEEDEQAWGLMKELGYRGLEIAPTRVFEEQPYGQLPGAALFAGVMYQKYGFVIPSMQSIWYGQNGSVFEPAQADALREYTIRAFEFARACRCPSLVFGCPRNRAVPLGHAPEEADGFFRALGLEAARRGLRLALEANPPLYGTNFLNTTAQAAALVRRLGTPGLALNLDVGALLANGEKVAGLAGLMGLVSHVHISRPGLAPIAPHPIDRELALLLGAVGYRGFVSVVAVAADQGPLQESLQYVAEVFG